MKTILIVDDENDFCWVVKEYLELSGAYSVITETAGKEAFRLAEQLRPDLILLDVLMPDMNGLDVLKRLKESKRTAMIPVIMLTAVGDSVTRNTAARLYDEDYIVKPVKMVALKDKIDDLLSRLGPTV